MSLPVRPTKEHPSKGRFPCSEKIWFCMVHILAGFPLPGCAENHIEGWEHAPSQGLAASISHVHVHARYG